MIEYQTLYIISDKTTAQEIESGVQGLRYGWWLKL